MGIASLRWLLLLDLLLFLRVLGCLALRGEVFNHVRGSLDPDGSLVVKTLASSSPGNLLELAHGKDAYSLTVVLEELCHQHRTDWNVYADAEGVGPDDYFQQALLGQLLHEEAVFGQEPRVVDSDPVGEEPLEVLPDRCIEAEVADLLADGRLLLFGADRQARERLCSFQRGLLGEVDDVRWRPARFEERLDRFVDRGVLPREVQRHRSFRTRDRDRLSTRSGGHVFFEISCRPERR